MLSSSSLLLRYSRSCCVSDVLRQHQRLSAALYKKFSSRHGAVRKELTVQCSCRCGCPPAPHLTATATGVRARADSRLTRVAGAVAAVPEDASHEIVAIRIDASKSQRWSARGLVMPRGGGGGRRASAFNQVTCLFNSKYGARQHRSTRRMRCASSISAAAAALEVSAARGQTSACNVSCYLL
jgi:hypothetical protein